ncbi:MAG: WYL domain-containing protein [Lentisphaeria bacterium]|nr:WYL domain-containing protein [Lentisphaeria bacterium]
MPKTIRNGVPQRLWRLVQLMKEGWSREELIEKLACSPRNLAADVSRLKKQGWTVKYARSESRYHINFPNVDVISLKLSPEEFFHVSYLINVARDEAFSSLGGKVSLACSEQTLPVYDSGPGYGVARLSEQLQKTLNICREAILKRRKLAFVYRSQHESKQPAIRLVHPYHLIHTPNSWYLIAWSETRQAFRRFKLLRMATLTLMADVFNRRKFDLQEYLGDAWWLRYDPERLNNPYHVEVRFFDEAAQSIKEYQFHPTQQVQDHPDGFAVFTCQLSYLHEFAGWLMQWLGHIQIVSPPELTGLIADKVADFAKRHDLSAKV